MSDPTAVSQATATPVNGDVPTGPAIQLDRVTFAYSADAPLTVDVPEWHLQRGQQVFIEGPSGTGKSTLLNLIAGTLKPTGGEIRILGQAFSALRSSRRDRVRAQHIGVVFQQFNLISYLSVAKNIEAAAHFAGKLNASVPQHINTLFEHLRLPQSVLHQRADSLSVGQQQRVAIARALINSPEILIVDEPTSALDTSARDTFMQLLLYTARDCCLIFVSHDTSLAEYFPHRVAISSINRASQGLL